jgi:cell wall-associated NlpC family hydrolase
MSQQMAFAVPWGLVSCSAEAALPPWYWSDDFEPPPLLDRPFRYGPSGTDGRGDCAALVRDWYRRERGIMLPEYPREKLFWLRPGVSYRDNMLGAGFVPADRQEPEVGDVFLAAIRSAVPNHAGIYMGGGKIMHHLQDRYSRMDPAVVWMRYVTDWFRYPSPA